MFRKDMWPFTPQRLSEIIDRSTLAVIEAGCCERLGRAMTIIDEGTSVGGNDRIDSINPRQNFAPFCRLLRDEGRVTGGNAACEACDIRMAQRCLHQESDPAYRTFFCHMGLLDATHVVKVRGKPVAVLFSGQFAPGDEVRTQAVVDNIGRLGSGEFANVHPVDGSVGEELAVLADELVEMPGDFESKLSQEAVHIEQIAEAAYSRAKIQWEQAFLDRLRAFEGIEKVTALAEVHKLAHGLLEQIVAFCRCTYAVYFANVRERDTVLTAIAAVGLPDKVAANLPHFNWRKANLPQASAGLQDWLIEQGPQAAAVGIRGENAERFTHASCVLPAMLASIYRGALVLGPFAEPVALNQERRFLTEIGRVVGLLVLTELQILHLQQQQTQWESTAKLLTHQARTALTPITTQVGMARLLQQKPQTADVAKLMSSSLVGAHELCLRLGKTIGETVKSHVLLLEPEDLKFDQYPLSVLVVNCAEGFIQEAERRQRHIVVEDNVEDLPRAEIDIARLTIALSNLIDNALKYSYPGTKITIRAAGPTARGLDLNNAIVEVQNIGDAIADEHRSRIFERGARGLTGVKLRRIPGSGLGLWETRAVVEAHGGAIDVRAEPTNLHFRQGRAHRITFSMKVPLRQVKAQTGSR